MIYYVRSEVFTVVKIQIFCIVTPHSAEDHAASIFRVKMEAA
jgi:hypothetical protein